MHDSSALTGGHGQHIDDHMWRLGVPKHGFPIYSKPRLESFDHRLGLLNPAAAGPTSITTRRTRSTWDGQRRVERSVRRPFEASMHPVESSSDVPTLRKPVFDITAKFSEIY